MNAGKIQNLNSLLMINGAIFANVNDPAKDRPIEVMIGGAITPFEEYDKDPARQHAFGGSFAYETNSLIENTASEPPEEKPGSIYACWVNEMTDWALAGSQTMQVMITRYDAACQINLGGVINVPHVRKGMQIEAYLGAHRANADLQVTMADQKTGQSHTSTVPFELSKPGGSTRDGYLHLNIPIPASFETCTVTFSIDYKGHVPDSKGEEPFVFIADAHVSQHQSPAKRASIVDIHRLFGRISVTSGVWFKAELSHAVTPGQNVAVKMGRQNVPVTRIPGGEITIRENYGHSIVFDSETAMDMVLFVDGKAIKRLKVGTHNNVIRLPNNCLTGAVRRVSLRDRSGTVTVAETDQLTPSIVTPSDVMQRESGTPYPTTLFAQTPLRYASLKATMAHATPETDLAQISYALSVLEAGYENVKLKPLTFPTVTNPDVSIVIPAHNKVEVTYLALCSLLLAHNKASFEVIVVDDASTDETATLEKIVSGITVLHNEEPQRFIRACNRGAAEAKGDYIVLLNNDVEVTSGWLDELVDAFSRFDNVGLAGSKLLYPSGELQDAGGIIWGSGNPWNYGNSQNPNEPRFSYARQADYLSGAAMMVPTKLWKQLDGLSSYMEPMYFEDTDFAFKVREAGYTTWFVPSSIVYHYEGMTSGTDVSTGFKKFQEVNRPKFKRRWAQAFTNFGQEGKNPDLEKDRGIVGRVLFVDYATPRMDRDAGSYAAIQEIRLVQSLGYKVTFMPTNMAHLGNYTAELQKMGVEVIHAPFFMNVSEYLSKHAGEFDAFYLTRYYVGQAVLEQIRIQAPNARVLFNNADLHFLREIRAAQSEGDSEKMETARQTRIAELDIINKVDVVLSYNDVEHSVIQAYTDGEAKVVKCPWVVDVPAKVPALSKRKGMSFLGSFKHHPNTEGVLWFNQNVMPLVSALADPVALTIYGSGMDADVRALKSDLVKPHGFVENAADAYDKHRVFVAPLLSGAGIKGKVLSALAHGIPCVLSPTAAEGIGLRSGLDCFVAETPQDWLDAIVKLNTDDALWQSFSDNARSYVADAFSFEHGRTLMRSAFEAADLFGSRA